jgi:hypothetical protein
MGDVGTKIVLTILTKAVDCLVFKDQIPRPPIWIKYHTF